jgi:hypothetical protein
MSRSALLAVLAMVAAAAPPLHAQERVTPLSRARELGAGATVLVEGTVSVAPGAFDGGFAIQDHSAGIWVLAPADSVRLRVGQRVRVRGTLDEPNGQLAIMPAAIGRLGAGDDSSPGAPPSPRDLRTGLVNESMEGWLVKIRGRVAGEVVNDDPWGWKVMVDDGTGPVLVFVDAETNVDVRPLRPGDTVEVTGFAGQYDDHYEVVPREQVDVRIIPSPSALSRSQ